MGRFLSGCRLSIQPFAEHVGLLFVTENGQHSVSIRPNLDAEKLPAAL
jgi:hypothetical protein